MKILYAFIISFFFLACSHTKELNLKQHELSQSEQRTLKINENWWQEYENQKLNALMQAMLENNSELNVARINLLSAIARYDLIDFDLYPTLSGNLGASVARDLNLGTNSQNFSNALNLSYELDIYGKIYDERKSSEFSVKASEFDLESLKLSLINSSIDNIFDLAYFNDVESLLSEHLSNLEQMKEIYTLKYELGKIEELDLLNIEQSLLNARQNLLSNAQNKELTIKNLKDLLGSKQNFMLISSFDTLKLADFKDLSLNFDLPLALFAHRPDIKSKASSLQGAFLDISVAEKSMFPSISLGSSLSGGNENLNQSFKLLTLGGNLQISLPFLDYPRVKQNIKISRLAYEALRLEYEQSLQTAINEFYLCYKDYEFYNKLLANIKLINEKQEKITLAYAQKYDLGKSELKDYLDAKNSLISSAQELLRSRLNVLKTTNLYYKITTAKLEN
ncbi:TolC family protein [Campylobacter sp. MIT 12-8780]|uniref:TolC family protein n=1 Tax=unclassified Campylobacter TaxID=2593542 RepID=UPI00115C7437|nr:MULTISPECIES: TolC family protein [unclassified Campylobacter]NDJ26591.1 TolC family protein [Campylobacter sp. MIT 19-121]TQR43157.1 TolC family protein [Campylobacter sp. MIT 12-8780]